MTTWESQTTTQTGWGETTPFIQVIEFIDNEYPINYEFVDINGKSISNWESNGTTETAWS